MNDLTTVPARNSMTGFLRLWLSSQDSPATRRTYESSLRRFADYVTASTLEAAVELLLGADRGTANALVEGWRAALRADYAPNTVNLRLTAIREIVNCANRFGLIDWKLDVDNVPTKAYRDTRGPGRENFLKMRAAAAAGDTPLARRDTAMLRLLHDTALRSKEVLGLKMSDVDCVNGLAWITGKGRSQRESITLPAGTLAALVAWIESRGSSDGYLFCRLDVGGSGSYDRPLAHKSLWERVVKYGAGIGIKAAPHGLRHSGITRAADATNGDMVAVAAFARHANLNTTKIYIDNAKDKAGAVARLVAED